MNCSYKNKPCEIITPEYSRDENFLKDLKTNGYVFLENAVDIDVDYKKHPSYSADAKIIDVVENLFPDDREYHAIYNSFKKSKAFKLITDNLNKVRLYNFMCFRLYKDSGASSMHRDDDFAITYSLNTNFIICWMPLTNVPINAGPLAIATGDHPNVYTDKDKQEASNYVKKYLHSPDMIDNVDGIRKAMLNEDDYKIDVKRDHNSFIAKDLKVGDVVIFTNEKVHGSLDNQNILRSSVDIRFFYDCDMNNEPLMRATLDL